MQSNQKNHAALLRILSIVPLALLMIWCAASYRHHFTLAVRTCSCPLVLRNLGSSFDIAYTHIGAFPGNFYANVEDGITYGGRYVDTVFECAGFAIANAGHRLPYPLVAVVIPVWPFFVGVLVFGIFMWRKSILAPRAFPVENPRPRHAEGRPLI